MFLKPLTLMTMIHLIDIKIIYKPYDENHFEVLMKITINCKSKKNQTSIFQLELDYLGFFEA